MTDSPQSLFWHRRDLRTIDNVGLEQATENGRVLPVFVLDPNLLSMAGTARTGFLLASLSSLQQTYREMNTDLLVRRGDPKEIVPALADKFDAKTVTWNQDHSKVARERDGAVRDALPTDIITESPVDMTLHEPGSIRTNAGEYYSVFSYYFKKWSDRPKDTPAAQPSQQDFASYDTTDIMDLIDPPRESIPLPAGRRAAEDRLASFLDGPIYEYAELRDKPAAEGSSRLSQDLSMGLLGIREVFEGTARAKSAVEAETPRESVTEFQRQLAWRDFYIQVLDAHPNTVSENFKSYENQIEWRDEPGHFTAWTDGKTGYPIVDAGMRQLQAESYMHNRVRMLVASFLTKDLQLDWRKGYQWFRTHLLDHETANDVAGWQWAASTGTDAQPYFRVFNPMTQGERYDPEAEYITSYISELAGVDPETIHSWHELDRDQRQSVAPDYPGPIVDHQTRRKSAIEMFKRARGDDS
ncbi:cryptochrome/photolyase family protein [Halodesulfurarchaeum sp.]|uniref:cryptochrome/photolyase family protein n=1 Tax=Halodesulfurarchaeum sp. TaxID=1980530 RepID=UPI002FC2A9F0